MKKLTQKGIRGVEYRKAQTEKHCKKCDTIKPIEEFRLIRKSDWTYYYSCKKCQNRMTDKRRRVNPTENEINRQQRRREVKYKNLKIKLDNNPLLAQQRREMARKKYLKKKYVITQEDYKNMFIKQEGVCKICNLADLIDGLVVDHCHETGKIRGLLCGHCNRALGKFKDSKPLLLSAIKYLENSKTAKEEYLIIK